ncbi:MAG: transketolase, partial [Oscillospiraceae bacterium]
MDDKTKKGLKIFATKARMGVIEGVYNAKAGHPGGSLSICDVLSYLYNVEMNVDPKNPKMDNRDR